MPKEPHEVIDDTIEPDEAPMPGRIPQANVRPLLVRIEKISSEVDVNAAAIAEITRTAKVLLRTIKHFEKKFGKEIMPEGTYLGETF